MHNNRLPYLIYKQTKSFDVFWCLYDNNSNNGDMSMDRNDRNETRQLRRFLIYTNYWCYDGLGM